MLRLADKSVYLTSKSNFYRVLRRSSEGYLRGHQVRQQKVSAPLIFIASGFCKEWSCEITWLPSVVRSRGFYLYMILDLYCRKITEYKVYET